jgi:F-type H+-transporting ATPase subunit epsilon
MKFLILSPRRKLLEEEVHQVILPGEDGEWSCLDFHQACLYRLHRGWVRVITLPKQEKKFLIPGGIAKIIEGMLTVLVDES